MRKLILQKRETELLRNLFLALKLIKNEALIRENWKKILTFGVQKPEDNRRKILFQSLTLYIVKLFDMPQTEIKNLSKELPDTENSWVDAIPEIFGEKWKKAGMKKGMKLGREIGIELGREEGRKEGVEEGREKGIEEKNRNFTLKTIQKFPDWSNDEVASFVGVTSDYVQRLRDETAQP